ncbi:MAG: 3-deoxy-7-phosphoheptulonate synthase [Candidatus Omnitrophica bacterium]|nr:3-deoxy-7-phosphoheptulonate synthase [Candidatus Omnitrophota bacterium]MBU1997519.1 3-deoxy-7-phosphoheptulonate synthase [Candidatus Omnitrophota bacterium]MBU4333436.1 3-deoxy-7-phosphoheptulonate synthase [Candidatus Omnitrophota bacterium]
MSFKYVQKIPEPDDILSQMPLDKNLSEAKKLRDQEVIDIITSKSDKFLLIIGPCSADNEDSVCEYVSKLATLQDKVQEKLVLLPRIYTNKPRTTGVGYKGMAHQPDPNEAPNIVEGIKAIRKMHIRALSESGLSAADEMLYPGNYPYLEDLLSYVAIGARSVENQQHRLTVSGLDVPIGMKNPMSGDLTVMLNAIYAAQTPHVFIYNGWEVNTSGNPFVHSIMRGAVNSYGRNIPNYHFEDLERLVAMYDQRDIVNQAIIVDTNHGNSGKQYLQQPRISKEVMYSKRKSEVIGKSVKGLMIESYLVEGREDIGKNQYGQSITDPCIGWEDTEKLVMDLAELV